MAHYSTTNFGALLRRYRTKRLLTQEQLAHRASLSPDTIRALESGKRRAPRATSLHLLIDALALTDAERSALLSAASWVEPTSARARAERTPSGAGAVTWSPASVVLGVGQPGALVGRESELQTILEHLARGVSDGAERARLLTLTGPAGVGKTRLALAAVEQLASQYSDGAALVDLTPVREPLLVLPSIARAVGLADIGAEPLSERLRDYLAARTLLIVLDNFEHVLPAAGALADLLAHCPGLTVLATSRIPLRLRWEWTLRIEPLPTPDLTSPLPSVATLEAIPAVALFMERARVRQPSFAINGSQAALVARLTAELDGLPLAIELAAARLETLTLPVLAHRLGDRLRLLRWDAQDVPLRQHSLEAAVGWSYDLLSEREQQMFRCLGVFVGHVSPPAIASVYAAVASHAHDAVARPPERPASRAVEDAEADAGQALEQLASLAEKSLILPIVSRSYLSDIDAMDGATDAYPAFRMLETVREYAWERLAAAGELETAQRAHARYFQLLAEQASDRLRGAEQRAWFLRLENEHNNLRAALRWRLSLGAQEDDGGRAERVDALRIASALAYFWWSRGYLAEGWQWIEQTLHGAPDAAAMLRLRALLGAVAILSYQGKVELAREALREAMALAQDAGQASEIAQAQFYAGMCEVYASKVDQGIPHLRTALSMARTLGDHHLAGLSLMYLGGAALAQGDLVGAEASFAESLVSFEQAVDGRFAGNLHVNLGWFVGRRGDIVGAIRHVRVGLEAGAQFEERRLLSAAIQVALSLSAAAQREPDLPRRARLLGAVDGISQATGQTLMQRVLAADLDALRAAIGGDEDAELETQIQEEYQRGRSMRFAVATEEARAFLRDLTTAHKGKALTSPAERARGAAHGSWAAEASLTARQQDVLRLVAQGLSNKDIAQRLYLSANTVTYHLRSIFNKLDAATRAQAVAVAARQGML